MLLAVNYHYIGMPIYPFPGVHSMNCVDFLNHVNWLKKHFNLVGINELMEYMKQGKFPSRMCMITFDDGLRCHYENVRPLMEKHDFPAAFFVSSQPLIEGGGLLMFIKVIMSEPMSVPKIFGIL